MATMDNSAPNWKETRTVAIWFAHLTLAVSDIGFCLVDLGNLMAGGCKNMERVGSICAGLERTTYRIRYGTMQGFAPNPANPDGVALPDRQEPVPVAPVHALSEDEEVIPQATPEAVADPVSARYALERLASTNPELGLDPAAPAPGTKE